MNPEILTLLCSSRSHNNWKVRLQYRLFLSVCGYKNNCCRGLVNNLLCWAHRFTFAKDVVFFKPAFLGLPVCLVVCLTVSKITWKVMNRFSRFSRNRWLHFTDVPDYSFNPGFLKNFLNHLWREMSCLAKVCALWGLYADGVLNLTARHCTADGANFTPVHLRNTTEGWSLNM